MVGVFAFQFHDIHNRTTDRIVAIITIIAHVILEDFQF